ncbi:MAG: iron-sulfur cluster assembly accessory protein [Chloroflexota bacterium]|nr:iron-sulfur cluster assembly accessory protein [Chloroflexota bacterium]
MIEVTAEAVEKLKSIMEDEEAEDSALRVVVVPAGQGVQYMLTLESEQNDDDVLTVVDGVRVLIDADSAPIMQGACIDYVEDLMRSGFTINNPNVASAGCGCGAGADGCGCGAGGCGCGGH